MLLLASDKDGTGSQKVIGFGRMLEVVGDSSAALVESGEGKILLFKLII